MHKHTYRNILLIALGMALVMGGCIACTKEDAGRTPHPVQMTRVGEPEKLPWSDVFGVASDGDKTAYLAVAAEGKESPEQIVAAPANGEKLASGDVVYTSQFAAGDAGGLLYGLTADKNGQLAFFDQDQAPLDDGLADEEDFFFFNQAPPQLWSGSAVSREFVELDWGSAGIDAEAVIATALTGDKFYFLLEVDAGEEEDFEELPAALYDLLPMDLYWCDVTADGLLGAPEKLQSFPHGTPTLTVLNGEVYFVVCSTSDESTQVVSTVMCHNPGQGGACREVGQFFGESYGQVMGGGGERLLLVENIYAEPAYNEETGEEEEPEGEDRQVLRALTVADGSFTTLDVGYNFLSDWGLPAQFSADGSLMIYHAWKDDMFPVFALYDFESGQTQLVPLSIPGASAEHIIVPGSAWFSRNERLVCTVQELQENAAGLSEEEIAMDEGSYKFVAAYGLRLDIKR